jgi:CubicO group peptidase (beta-lactamase class C family)
MMRMRLSRLRAVRLFAVAILAVVVLTQTIGAQQNLTYLLFERYLDALRGQAGIPGLSAAIVADQSVVWEKGFGLQDVERNVAATPNTPYLIGDLTQTFGSALVLRCVEDADVALGDSIRRWTDQESDQPVTVRHVLSHSASSGSYQYDPARFAVLTPIVSYCGQQPFPRFAAEEILSRFGMTDTVPGHDVADSGASVRQLFDQRTLDQYGGVVSRLAVPYRVDRSGKATRSDYPAKGFNAATGLISTVRDLARWDAALDSGAVLRSDTRAAAWANTLSSSGSAMPTGLGWFVQSYNGQRVVWHFGLLRDSFSSLIVKVPARNLTLILLANSDGLSASFPLSNGDVTVSVFAQLFLRTFVP